MEQKNYVTAIVSTKQISSGETNSLRMFQGKASSKEEALGFAVLANRKELPDNNISLFATYETIQEPIEVNGNEAMNNEIANRCIRIFKEAEAENSSFIGIEFRCIMEEISKKYPR